MSLSQKLFHLKNTAFMYIAPICLKMSIYWGKESKTTWVTESFSRNIIFLLEGKFYNYLECFGDKQFYECQEFVNTWFTKQMKKWNQFFFALPSQAQQFMTLEDVTEALIS